MAEVITIDYRGMDSIAKIAEEFPRVGMRALNRVGRSTEVLGNRLIRETYNLSRARVDEALSTRIASVSNLQYVIRARGNRLPLIAFNPRQTRSGITLIIKKGNRKTLPGLFLAEMQSGHMGVFMRKGAPRVMRSGMYMGKKRQPIVEKYTISVAEMFGTKRITSALEDFAYEKLPEEIMAQLQYFLSSGK